jgi:hypothetical protein
MLSEEIMSVDKQIGRIYNHIDRLTSKWKQNFYLKLNQQ